ncbi:aldehyde-alcohol dehydrogenase [Mycolicibacterium mageritense DSM 44476 = CIP 104973]|uniref:Aldehyde dehydrogenase n=1 Tax=Mycolicibacterium mageritense TaxID=53462 RepID=A0ABM7HQ33_MYCME|nr:aldehyde dehydrogenase family protein [Mycolicibacterium mageritense]MCC9180257.1 aldehyde dehydrogenase family protein [Mycolicibacterium mageritense]BBX32644.1 aldehyde dehydrogenase [Mycolicibacterium mageritense]CDO22815.1 aldehyde-alcohol dehydrogenase [Mycolicibacterium mageritense DSM 44476 = CIP 104973]
MTNTAQAGHMLERARWAAAAYADYDASAVTTIVNAVAEAGYAEAERFATEAVAETGMGVAADKVTKNRACSRGIVDFYRGEDYVSPRIDEARKIVELPRPAGVVLALTPTTNPVATVYFKVILALMTRNAVVVAPHPRAKRCSADAARVLAEAAVAAGAPDGIVQVVDEPSIPLVQALMADERTDVIVATGGTGVVRAAYSSGNPALGVGPGNVPVFVDASADINAAAKRIVDSKAFDNSVLCTNESVLIVEEVVADKLRAALTRAGAHILDEDGARRLRDYMFTDGHLNTDVVGRDAAWIAGQAGLRVTPKTRVLIAPFSDVITEEMLAHEKLSPVLGMTTVADAARGIRAARAVVRIGGAGHSAAIHSENPAVITDFAAQVPVLRVSVNVGNSTGSSGLDTNLAPSMTIGTGFVGRSSIGENLQPQNLINWARVAYNSEPGVVMGNFAGINPWRSPAAPVPEYPRASNDRDGVPVAPRRSYPAVSRSSDPGLDALRAELRALVVEELAQLIKR